MKLKELWNKLAKKNSKYYIFTDKGKEITEADFRESGYQDYIKYILEDDLLQREGIFLEIGCGTGRMTAYIIGNVLYEKVIGVDISREMIKQAKKRLNTIKNVFLYETDGKTLPIADNYVDVAFSYLVFQHIKTKKMVESNFKEVYRVLKKNGIFKVLLRTDKVSLKSWWGGVNYSEKEATILAHNLGFYVEKIEKVNNYGLWMWLKK